MPPFFTIITSTYNAAATLPRLLDSLASQTCRDFNWIVQDGASADTTMQIVARYQDDLPEILADSTKDKGIYDAWNKAIDRWQNKLGAWVIFLGGDDILSDKDILAKIKFEIEHLPSIPDIICTTVHMINNENKIISSKYPQKNYPGSKYLQAGFLPACHTGMFFMRDLIKLYRFDPSYRIAGDYDFLQRTWNDSKVVYFDLATVFMGNAGVSSSPQNLAQLRWEYMHIRTKYCPKSKYLTLIPCITKSLILHIIVKFFGNTISNIIIKHIRTLAALLYKKCSL